MSNLKYSELREANLKRVPQFRDRQGRLCHKTVEGQPVGYDWKASQWSNAVLGELGELANLIKKLERGDFDQEDIQTELAYELADVAIYLDLLAHRLGVDLGAAIVEKFNIVSDRVSADVYLPLDTP